MITMSYDEIKRKLVFHNSASDEIADLKLGVSRISFGPDAADVVFVAVDGSPPRGYALYIPAQARLVLYDEHGIPFETMLIEALVGDPGLRRDG
jgi:hypothetical protein